MKNVQITYELFLELIKYHLLESDACNDVWATE